LQSRRYVCLIAVGLTAAAAITPAHAQDAVRRFYIGRRDVSAALTAMALQADVSIGRGPGVTCAARTAPLVGRYTVREALDRLLKGSGCTYRMVDARTILIVNQAKPPAPKPAPPPLPRLLEQEVVVTASRRQESIERSPYDVTRVGQGEMAAGRIFDSGGLASLVAGMTVTNLGPGRDKILLRGLSDGVFTGRTQSTVSLYLDDAPLTYNAPDPDLRLVDVESVEVLRGPQGVLYGAGSIGGVVHVITRKPDLETYSASLDVTGAATQGGAPSSVVEGVVNLPLLQDRFGVRIAAYREADGGYIDDLALRRKDVNSTDRTGARILVLLQLTPDWKATVGGVYQSIASADTQYSVAGLPAYTRDNQVQEPHDNDFDELTLVVEGAGDGWRFKSSTAHVRHQIDSQYDAGEALTYFAPGLVGAAAFNEADHKSLVSQEFTLASNTSGKAQWIVGLFALDDQENSASRLNLLSGATAPASLLYSENRSDTIDEYAAYGELTYSPLHDLFLTVGGRAFQSRASTGSAVATPSAARSISAKIQDQGFAPKIVARYQISGAAMVYAQATEGYRGGGLNTSGLPGQAFGTIAAGSQPFQKFTGDELWNYEVGAKVTDFASCVSLRTAAFYDSWQNIQTDQILPSGLPFTANVGDGVNRGVEIEALYQPTPRLFFRGNAVFNDPDLINRAPGFASVAHASLPGIARVSFGAEARYARPLTDTITAFASARASYVGRSTLGFDATTMAAMGRYGTGAIAAGVNVGPWTVEGFVDNPVNTIGDTFAFGNPFSIRSIKQTTPLRPRTLGLSLSAAF
jgi:outer membrane receptor protein involved in Fe transport